MAGVVERVLWLGSRKKRIYQSDLQMGILPGGRVTVVQRRSSLRKSAASLPAWMFRRTTVLLESIKNMLGGFRILNSFA